MKKTLLFAAAVLAVLGCAREELAAPVQVQQEDKPLEIKYIPGSIIVKFTEEMAVRAEEDPDAMAKELGFSTLRRLFPYAGEFEPRTRKEGLHRYYKAYTDVGLPPTKAAGNMSSIPGVEMATPQLPVQLRSFDDPMFSMQWNLQNTRYKNADINITKVWEEFTVGSDKVIVAVADEGVYMDHEDLAPNLVPCYADGSGSFNFNNNTPTVVPTQGHGTHVAGTIAAVNNNGIGVCSAAGGDAKKGIAGVKVMSCQIFDLYGNAPDYAAALKHGADHGAVILQCSWGFSPDLNGDGTATEAEIAAYREVLITDPVLEPYKAGIDYFLKYAGCDNNGNQLPDSPMKGGVVVFAAGNDDFDFDPLVSYEPVIAVGSYGFTGARSSFSNYGDWIDISAPGGEVNMGIYSTLTNNSYGGNDWIGTSFSAPLVSGVAALLASYYGGPGFTAEECRTRLIRGAKANAFTGTKYIGRKLDAYGAFTYDMNATPQPPVITVAGQEATKEISYRDNTSISIMVEDPINELCTLSLEPLIAGLSFGHGEDGLPCLNIKGALLPAGDFSFKVVATNESGLRSSREFRFSVTGDRLPVMAKQGLVQVTPGGDPTTIDLQSIITDPDGDPLTFTATSADESILEALVSGSTLRLTAKAEGRTTVTVRASDGYEKADFTLDIYAGVFTNSAMVEKGKVFDKLTLSLGVPESTDVEIEIYNTAGAVVFKTVVQADAFHPATIRLRDLPPGRYVLVARHNGIEEKLPFVKY